MTVPAGSGTQGQQRDGWFRRTSKYVFVAGFTAILTSGFWVSLGTVERKVYTYRLEPIVPDLMEKLGKARETIASLERETTRLSEKTTRKAAVSGFNVSATVKSLSVDNKLQRMGAYSSAKPVETSVPSPSEGDPPDALQAVVETDGTKESHTETRSNDRVPGPDAWTSFPDDQDADNRMNAAITAYGNGDFERAADIWHTLARSGHPTAQFHLGAVFLEGHGVEQDSRTAYIWLKLADERGVSKAERLLRERSATFSAEIREEAEKLLGGKPGHARRQTNENEG